SILGYLLQLNIRTMATTHYSQLKIYALTTDNVRNASVEFDIETLSPTYRLLIGVPGKSNAFEISQRLGLQDYIIDYAREMISKENVEFEDVLQAIDKDRRITEERKLEAERLQYEVDKLKDELNREKERIEKSKDRIILRAKEEARSILRRAKDESDGIIKELKQVSKAIDRDRNRKIQESQERLKLSLDEVEGSLSEDILNVQSKEPPRELNMGDKVEVLSLNQVGDVLEPPDDDGNVLVQVGLMKVNVHISTLKLSKDEDAEKTTVSTKRIIRSKSSHIKNEIDLRGTTLDDALLTLDKYIDDVYIAGLKEASIIHGKGTGVLRKGIREYVRGHRLIKSSRPGKHGEGGDGVTIIGVDT
ncbi:MAG: endonuclease MutS2, partial [Tissierellia bacterium]|nr:endonuclease MutS2 [Tissierellia bacterium]